MIKSRGVLKMSQRSRHDMKDQKKKKNKRKFQAKKDRKGNSLSIKKYRSRLWGF